MVIVNVNMNSKHVMDFTRFTKPGTSLPRVSTEKLLTRSLRTSGNIHKKKLNQQTLLDDTELSSFPPRNGFNPLKPKDHQNNI